MSDACSLHVLCRYEGRTPKGLILVDRSSWTYDSVSWRVAEDDILGLIGKTFCMHLSKSEPSYRGGKFVSIRREAIDDNGGAVRAIVRFEASMDATGLAWPPTDNPNEYHRVNYHTPVSQLR